MISALRVWCRGVFFCLSAAQLVCLPTVAQRGGEFGRAAALLPSNARAIVDRLGTLRELPAGTWRMHAGDIPHGENASLDDSSWAAIAIGEKAPNEAVWIRRTVEVPANLNGYDLTGARIWFQMDVNGNGPMPEILYFNGRRVAMGEDLEPEVLFDKAQPGDKVTVAVKILHTVDTKTFRGVTMRIDFAPGRPNPEDLREEFLGAALLVPSLAPGDEAKATTLNEAIHAVNIDALDAQDQAKFDASLKAAHEKLEALKPLLDQAMFHLDGNAHIDAAWLWPWTETVDVVKRTFSTALQLMDEYPDYKFTQSAAAYNEWMADKYPDLNAQIKRRIEEGRWEIVGGMWVEPDLNLPDGESLVRQLLVGKRWYKQAYGVDVRIGWNPDSFGYTWQLPQIYKKSGIDYFVTQKMAWNDTNQLPFKLFWWESPDGSKVLAYFPHDYVNLTLNPVRLSDDLKAAREHSPGLIELLDLYGVGDHGGGPTRAILDEGFHWSQPGHVTPKYEFGTAQSFFSSVEKQIAPDSPTWNYQSIARGYTPPALVAGKVSIPTWKSELYFEYHRGVMTTQANHKANMRHSEEEVLTAEKWASFAWLDGREYPATELTEDWKKVLFNQFHDLAAGSGIGVIYKDGQKDYDVVRWSTDEISRAAVMALAANIDSPADAASAKAQAITVFNPLGWSRSGEVWVDLRDLYPASVIIDPDKTDSHLLSQLPKRRGDTGDEYLIPITNVPALGYKTLYVGRGPLGIGPSLDGSVQQLPATLALANETTRITVDETSGCITSIHNKKSNQEALASGSCGNQLQFFKDLPKQYDAWNIDPGTLDVPPVTIDKADSVESVGGDGIRVTRHWQNSKFVQTIRLEGDIIDIDNEIDWHERHVLLKAAFPVAVASGFATYEIPYGAIERPTTRNNSWEKAQFEVPAMRWADLSGAAPDGKVHGLSLLNQTKFGYDAVGNVLRISLLRAPTWPDPEADQGHHHFHYAIYPHAGTWKDAQTVRRGWEYNYPLTAVVTTAHPGSVPAEHSFASVSPENVALTAVKKAEDADGLILRVYEWAGKSTTAEFHVPPGSTGATVTNLMEQPEGSPFSVEGDVVKVPIRPYEILTIRVTYPRKGRGE